MKQVRPNKVYQFFTMITSLFIASCQMQPAWAQDKPFIDTMGVHLGSIHSNNYDPVANRAWNNYNPGVYFRHENWVAGTYFNSIRKQSFYAGYVYGLTSNIDIVFGAVSGYNGPGYRAKPVMPMVVPSFHFPLTDAVSARINLAVGVGKGSATAVNFALEWKL